MSVRVRHYRKRGKDGWEVDIRVRYPSGEEYRERVKAPVSGKAAALRWGQDREAFLFTSGKPPEKRQVHEREVPTFQAFAPRYIDEYARANRQKPSTIIQKERMIAFYLMPRFGKLRLDEVSDAEVSRLKADLSDLNVKTVNNVLIVIRTMFKAAVEWGVIGKWPATVKLLKAPRIEEPKFYEPYEYERLVAAAEAIDPRIHLLVLLGGDAGLRLGEIIALEQTDVDLRRGLLTVRQSEWEGFLTAPKSGRSRKVVLTERLKKALAANRHLRGARVLWRDDGFPKVTQVLIAKWMRRAQRRAGLRETGAVHILRHTFCSRLAMAGASTKAIQELAGHQEITTTQRYMHLSPSAKSAAIALLDAGADLAAVGPEDEKAGLRSAAQPAAGAQNLGDMLETPGSKTP